MGDLWGLWKQDPRFWSHIAEHVTAMTLFHVALSKPFRHGIIQKPDGFAKKPCARIALTLGAVKAGGRGDPANPSHSVHWTCFLPTLWGSTWPLCLYRVTKATVVTRWT